jgi:hypothetical protein
MNKKIIFIIIGIIIGLIALNIPVSKIVGSAQSFSLFDLMAPSFGAFLASWWGAISVILVKSVNALFTHQQFDLTTIIRLFPLALGAFYFGTRKSQKLVALVPLACLILFILHPEGRQAWYYSLYWLIPVATVFAKRSLVLNSLGATFTAHSVGSVAFLYAFNLPAEVWIALIPVVFIERMIFTGGTALSYVLLNSLTNWLADKLSWPSVKKLVRSEYVISKQLLTNL